MRLQAPIRRQPAGLHIEPTSAGGRNGAEPRCTGSMKASQVLLMLVALTLLSLRRPAFGQGGISGAVSPSPSGDKELETNRADAEQPQPAEKSTPSAKQPTPVPVANTERVIKIPEAGLQFELPKQWNIEVTKTPATSYQLTKKDSNSYFAFIPSDENDLADGLNRSREAMRQKAKSYEEGEEKTGKVNGLTYTYRVANLVHNYHNHDLPMTAIIGAIMTKTPVVFIRVDPKDGKDPALDRIWHSVKAAQ